MIRLPKFLFLRLNIYFLAFLGFNTRSAIGQESYNIHKQDVLHFWEAYDSLVPGADSTEIFQRLVINRASSPFRQFIKKGNITARNYVIQIRKYPKFYRSIRTNSLRLINAEKETRTLIEKLRSVYPDLIPAEICIAFGNFFSGGTVHVEGKTRLVYIGVEYHGLDSTAVVSEFNQPMKDYLSRSNFFRTVIHELIHVQQETHGRSVIKSYYGDKLIHSLLREGVADFIAKLIYPEGNDGRYVEYGLKHEAGLKEKLAVQLWGTDKAEWIYNSNNKGNEPADLGYFMGSRIAKAFYEQKKNDPDVIRKIIEIKDVKEFVKKSAYFED